MSESGSRKYIGVDLGAWSSTKTRIAVLECNGKNLKLLSIKREPTYSTEDPSIRNEKLKKYLLEASEKDNTIIAIDAPFAIPSLLGCSKNIERYYLDKQDADKKFAIQNQYLFDNSARFVYKTTKQMVLAPTATLVGALTSRMAHIIDNYFNTLGICKVPNIKKREERVLTIEVFPTATLYKMIKFRELETDYLEPYTKKEQAQDPSKFTKIKSYKNDNWNSESKKQMLELIRPCIANLDEREEQIKTDDDYDAIICALTAYFVDKNDYEKPDKKDIDKFTNSFIYIPKIK